jgi:parallel beta-helix repeat protein
MLRITVGAGGDYSTLSAALASLPSTFTQDVDVIVVSDTTEPSGGMTSFTKNLGGYNLTIRSSYPHRMKLHEGWQISCPNTSGYAFRFEPIGTGYAEIKDLRFKKTVNGGDRFVSFQSGGPDLDIHDIVVDVSEYVNGGTDVVVLGEVAGATGSTDIRYFNFLIVGGTPSAGKTSVNLSKYYASVSRIENATIIGNFSVGINCNNHPVEVHSCLVGNNVTTCFQNHSSAIGRNNAADDTTVSDGNWGTGTNNVPSITMTNEVASVTPGDPDYARVLSTGSIYNAGYAPTIALNVVGMAGGPRPHDGVTSIGADELPVTPRQGIQAGQVQLDTSDFELFDPQQGSFLDPGVTTLQKMARRVNEGVLSLKQLLVNVEVDEVLKKNSDGLIEGTAAGGAGHGTIITPTDDLRTIINAASNGDEFILTKGTHSVSNVIDLTGKSRIVIRGCPGAIISASHAGNVFQLQNCSDITFDEFEFNHNVSTSSYGLFYITGTNNVERINIRNIKFYNAGLRYSFIMMSGFSTPARLDDLVVENCKAYGGVYAFAQMNSATSGGYRNIVFKGNSCTTTYTSALWVYGSNGSSGRFDGLRFENNYVTGFNGGVSWSDTDGLVVVGNTFENLGNVTASYCVNADSSCEGVVVVGNNCYDQGGEFVNIAAPNSLIVGNTVRTTTDNGILVSAADCVIADNVVSGTTTGGIVVSGVRCVVRGNRVTGGTVGISFTNTWGIIEGNSVYNSSANGITVTMDEHVISGNRVEGAGAHGIEVGTAGTSSDHCVISNNVVVDCTSDGIHLEIVTESLINDNRCYNNGGDGIDEVTGSDQNLFDGNHLRGNTGTNFNQNGSNATLGTNKTT